MNNALSSVYHPQRVTDTAMLYPANKTIPDLFAEQVAAAPNAVALIFENRQLTYRELDESAARLAHYLQAKGAGPETLIPVCIERSPEMIVAILGILKAGAAYVPIDPAYPQDRIDYMMQDTAATLAVSSSTCAAKLSTAAGCTVVALDTEQEIIAGMPAHSPATALTPGSLAYVIYTSGSTGRPKGVLIEHGGVVNFVYGQIAPLGLRPGICTFQFSSLSFDASVYEIFCTLLQGGKLVLARREQLLEKEQFCELLNKHAVELILLPPSFQSAITDNVYHLKTVISGGEALNTTYAARIREQGVKVVNAYGPTENTVVATISESPLSDEDAVTIGKPTGNVQVYILDAEQRPVAAGTPGELYIAGAGLARGYLNRPELTAERFVSDPFSKENGSRMYRTGDLGRYLPDGNIEYLGRIDEQVKIRGYRIEPGEIEQVLLQSGLISAAVVLARNEAGGSKRLVAYIVPTGPFDRSGILAFAGSRLPEYMVPAAIVPVDALPLTPNGKVDKKALLEMEISVPVTPADARPRNETEQQLAGIWQELLQVQHIGIRDNFFELGGDSIIAIQVVSRAKRLGYMLRTADLYARQTVEQLALLLQQQQPAMQADAGEQGYLSGECALLPIQEWYFSGESFLESNYRYFNQSICTGIDKSVTKNELQQVVQELLRYHDALRFTYHYKEGKWVQEYGHYAGSVTTVEMGVIAVQSDHYQRRLAIEKGELVKVVLMYTPDTEHYNRLLIIVHHLAVDGVSWRILLEDIGTLLSLLREGRPLHLGHKGTSYRQWRQALADHGNRPALLSQLEYWERISAAQLSLPLDKQYTGALVSGDIARHVLRLPVTRTRQLLQDVPGVYRTEVNDILLAAFTQALCNWSGSRQLLVGLEGHGREDLAPGTDLSRTVGWFTNLYPVLLETAPDGSTGALIRSIKKQLRNIPDKGMGYGILKYIRQEPGLQGRDPWHVIFNYLGQMDNMTRGNKWLNSEDAAMASISEEYIEREKLALNSWVQQGELVLEWSYSRKHYNKATIAKVAEAYLLQLEALITHCIAQQALTFKSWDDNITAVYPLTSLQEGMLFHGLYDNNAGAYIEQTTAALTLPSPALFGKAWESLLQRYTILRSGFYHDRMHVPVQGVHRSFHLPLTTADWSGMTAEQQHSAIAACCEGERQKGFDFTQVPLMRLVLLRTGADNYQLIWTYHHILLDGWSIPVLLDELVNTYETLAAGRSMANATDHFEDYIRYIEQQNSEQEEAYWKEYLSGVSGSTLLPFIARGGERTKGIGAYREEWWRPDEAFTARITAYIRQHRLTMNTLMQGVWALLLHRYTGSTNIVYGVTVSGRPEDLPGVEQRVGMYINTLPLHSIYGEEAGVVEWLQALQQHQQRSREYQYTALSNIQQWNMLPGDLFDSLLAFANYPASGNQDAGKQQLQIRELQVAEHTNYPFSISIETSPRLSILFSYNTAMIAPAYVRRIRGHFEQVLEQLLQAAPATSLGSIELTTPAERRELLEAFNDTTLAVPADATILDLFDRFVKQSPDAVAVVYEEQSLSYRQLNERSHKLARYLRAKGVGTETLVPLCIDRSLEMIVGILGILKAGGAYVPVDPAYPQERIDYMLQDTAAMIVVTSSACRPKLGPDKYRTIIELDSDWEQITGYSRKYTVPAISPRNLAYVIYTSGSTGNPKGVMIEHRGVVNLIHAQAAPLRLRPGICIFQFSSFSFDASCYEIFCTLLHGGKLVLAKREALLDATALSALLNKHKVSLITLPPSYQAAIADNVHHLETVVSAGEMLNAAYAARIQEQGVRLINAYGPTENTVCATLSISPLLEDGAVTIGTPNANVQIHILDAGGNLVPAGVPGEMYIGGAQVARGYLHRPELTAQRFVQDPFSKDPAGRMYRTGDLARWLPDGNIEYLGRIDDQVKIRGYRIELGEIETVLQQCELVEQAVVLARTRTNDNGFIIAYIKPAGAFDREGMISWLKSRLPEYMIPSLWAPVTAFKLTPNGKIDKKALPEPDAAGLLSQAYAAPGNRQEEQLAGIWASLLQVKQVGIHDDFFELGGNSLLAMRVIAAIRKTCDLELSIRELFANTTIAALSAHIANRKEEATLPPLHPHIRTSAHPHIPLSYSQERLWFIDQLQGSVAYHIPVGLQLSATTDLVILEQSLCAVVHRHEILRTVIRAADGTAWQEVIPAEAWALQHMNAADLRDEAALREYMRRSMHAPFDLAQDYMLRALLIRRPQQEPWLLLVVHHIAADGWSMSILLNELQEEYTTCIESRKELREALPLQYADYAIWQRNLAEEVMSAKLDYWKNQLQLVSPLQLPTDYTRPAVQDTSGGLLRMEVEPEICQGLNMLSQQEGVTLFMTLLAAFKVLLYRYTGQQDICVGVPVAGRTHHEVESLIGFFVNMLPLRSNLSSDTPFNELLQQIKQVTVEAYHHQETPFEKMVEATGAARDLSRNPIFDVCFALQNMEQYHQWGQGVLSMAPIQLEGVTAVFDLDVEVTEADGCLQLYIQYATALFREDTVERMFRHYKQLLVSILKDHRTKTGALTLLSPADVEQLKGFNNNIKPLPPQKTVDELIDLTADRYPEHIAIKHKGGSITYDALRRKANTMAALLQQDLQLDPETLAGMLTDRSIGMIAAIYGSWKAGCGYVPLHPGIPEDRLRVMINDARLQVLVYDATYEELAMQLKAACPTIQHLVCTTVMDGKERAFSKTPVSHNNTLAYVIYTSGSTGKPKGAVLEHAGVINHLCSKISDFQLNEYSCVAQNASQSFDVSVWQMFTALLTGGTTVVYDEQLVLRVTDFMRQLKADGITVLEIVPSYLAVMLEELAEIDDHGIFQSMQYMLVTGETVKRNLVERWFELYPEIRLINAYGPAEASDDIAIYSMDHLPDYKTVPVGKVIQNLNIYIVDHDGCLCPIGVTGEIWVSGIGVGRGYLYDEERTAAAFRHDPFLEGTVRLYKTGDLGRYHADGTLEFLGRKDHQVKIRGHRIELGEIEQYMNNLPGVKETVVIDREDHNGQLALYGYVTMIAGTDTAMEDLRSMLAKQLPVYMIPAHIMLLDHLPLTPNGKTDRSALPLPVLDQLPAEETVLPQNRVETGLATIWQQLLNLRTVSVTADFFELGGHSLKGTQLISRIYKKFGVKLSVKDIFRQPTIRALAERIMEEEAAVYTPVPKAPEQTYYETSNAQQRLWIIDRIEEDLSAYNVYATFHIKQPLDITAMSNAVRALVARHESLRTTFPEVAGVPKQYIHAADWPALELKVTDRCAAANTNDVLSELEQQGRMAMDLAAGPLFQVALYLLPNQACYLFLKMHHIICDGWSNNLLVKELLEAYQSFAHQRPLLLPPLNIQYKDYAAWQLEKATTPAFEAQRQFWLQQFRGDIPVLEFPSYRERPLMKTYNGQTLQYKFSKEIKDHLYALGARTDASLFMTLAAVCNVLLYKYTGQQDLIIGTAAAGRNHPDLEDQVGYYLNTLALRNEVDPGRSFLHFLEAVKTNTLTAFENQDYPFDTLVNELDLNRDMSRHPLFDVMLILQNLDEDAEVIMQEYCRELEITPVPIESRTAAFDMDLDFREEKDGLYLSLAYNTDLYEEQQMRRMIAHLEQLIQRLHKDPEAAIGAVGIADEEDLRQLQRFNDTAKAFDLDRTFYHYVEKFAAETPDKTAIIHQHKRLSYRQLNTTVNRMARVLRQQVDIQQDDLLAVFMDRSEKMAATILCIWKSGGAYIPIEKKFPDNRVVSILEDADVKAVIVERRLVTTEMAERMQACCTVLFLDELEAQAAGMDDSNLQLPFDPNSLSFAMFTSGSTGKPKGAMNEHIGMMNHSLATVEYLSMNEHTVLVQNASHGFDISVWQFFTPFITGGTTLVYDDEMVGMPEQFLQGLIVHKVTILQVVSSYLAILLDLIEKDPQQYALPLEFLVCCGEILKPAVARRWLAAFPGKGMVNDYGPAEASDGTSWYIFNQVPEEMKSIPVGSSIYNMSTYIVDDYMNICPAGVKGEICVGGIGVGRGYVNDPERTARVFMPDPFTAVQQRLYKTGDLGRYLPTGILEFHGRKDYQVKVNGQRIELGEIEVKLSQLPPVKDAVVLDLTGSDERKYLSAFVVLHKGDTTTVPALKEMLGRELPVYMIPRTFQLLDQLPFTPNGKIDRKLLAALSLQSDSTSAHQLVSTSYEPPVTEMEQLLAAAWSQVLRKDGISITDNFYELGGDSISAIQLSAYLYRNGFKVEIRDVMKLPTIRELARVLKPLSITAAQDAVTGHLPLTPIQAGFFAANKIYPHHYNQAVMLKAAIPLQEQAVREVLGVLLRWHDALRITFRVNENEVLQYNEDATMQPVLVRYELSAVEEPAAQMEQLAAGLQAGFSLQQGPLLKAAIFAMPDADYLFVAAHHLVMDGVSWRIWIEDFSTLHEKQLQQAPLSLPPKTDSYKRWAEQLSAYAASPAFSSELPYWKAVTETATGVIPYDLGNDDACLVRDLANTSIALDTAYTQQLVASAQWAFNTNINDLLLAAFGLATARMFGIHGLLMTLESHGREPLFEGLTTDRTIGWFTSEYPVFLDLSRIHDLPCLIKTIKEYLHQVPSNGIGFGIARYLAEEPAGKGITPQIIFNYLGAMEAETAKGDFELLEHAPGTPEAACNKSDYPLELIGLLRDGRLSFTLHYHSTQFRPATITNWLLAYRKALEQIIDTCLQQTRQELTPSDYDYKELSMDELAELKALLD